MMLDVHDLDLRYGQRTVLQRVSLTVAAGEVVLLVGLNGSGKSSLLKAVAGLVPKAAGEVRFKGRTLDSQDASRVAQLGIGYLPQGHKVFPSLTVAENLALASALSRRRASASGGWPLAEGQLARHSSKNAGLLSSGERQVLASAMLLAQGPDLMLLDEPSSSLSPALASALLTEIRTLCRQRGRSAVLVEQEVALALQFADRVYLLADGSAKHLGPPGPTTMHELLTHSLTTVDDDTYLGRTV